jgi:hypothetical protein
MNREHALGLTANTVLSIRIMFTMAGRLGGLKNPNP